MASALARALGVGLRRRPSSASAIGVGLRRTPSSSANTSDVVSGLRSIRESFVSSIAPAKNEPSLAISAGTPTPCKMSSLNVKSGILGSSANVSAGLFIVRPSHLVPKRLYSSLRPGVKHSVCTGTRSPYVCQRRLISFRTTFDAMKNNSMKFLKNSAVWLIDIGFIVVLLLKSTVWYHVQVLKKGFKDKAISLHFSALLFVGYAQFCRIVENSENRLMDLQKSGDGNSKVARMAIKLAPFGIALIKMLLMVFSSGEVEELRTEVNKLRTEVSGLMKKALELGSDNIKLTEEVKLLQLENSKLKEVKLIQSEGLNKDREE